MIMTYKGIGVLTNIKTQESKAYIVPDREGADNISWYGAFSRDKQHIALIKDNLVGFKNGLKFQADYEIELPTKELHDIAISDDGGLIIGARHPGRLFQYDVRQKKFTKHWDSQPLIKGTEGSPFSGDTYAIQFLHNSSSFVTAHHSGTVRIWKEPGVLLASIQCSDYEVSACWRYHPTTECWQPQGIFNR